MGRTLQPEDVIGHYKVVGPLGAGGMGEVYLAHDLTLERDVALKVLPAELVRSEDRVRRFVMEAKSASSLSHPHIVTIHEIGHEAVRPAGEAEAGGDEIHYIAMELIRGETLVDLIHSRRTNLKTLLGYLAQAAEGLSKAHAAGIVHRDLKPGNIMVTTDGYAKVLDFGLAKLTEKQVDDPDLTSAPTQADTTSAGTVVGTAGYMSPEQVKGKKIDNRSDVFSFGCILYEAATRTRPFTADSAFDVMHKIVHEEPVPVDEVNTEVPSELRRLIRRCLAKSPDRRLQSIKDLALELREIVDEFESLSASATSASGLSAPVAASRRSPLLKAGMVAVAILGLAGVAFGLWSLMSGPGRHTPPASPFRSVRMRTLIEDPLIGGATLSGDGRYLAYTLGAENHWSLRVRQIATGSDVEILPPQANAIRGECFSPDGNYLYYLGQDPETPRYNALFQVPSLGGTPRKRIFDIDSGLGFSPDGLRAAFVRGVPTETQYHLLVMDMNSSGQKILAVAESPEEIHFARPAWSPDGTVIVATLHVVQDGVKHALAAFDAQDGSRTLLTAPAAPNITSFAWLPDGSGLVATTQNETAAEPQIYFVPYPRGSMRQITNDVDGYRDVSVAGGMASLAAVRSSTESRLWLADLEQANEIRPITNRSSQEAISQPLSLPDGKVAFTATQGDFRQIWAMNEDGSNRIPLTAPPGDAFNVNYSPLDHFLYYNRYLPEESKPHIWRMNLDSGELQQITSGPGEIVLAVSPDGKTILYSRSDLSRDIWRISSDLGEPERFLEGFTPGDPYSPDGRYLAYASSEEVEGRNRTRGNIIPADGGEPVLQFLPPGDGSAPRWSPDSRGLTYIHATDNVENVWLRPVDGSDPLQLTRFTEGRLSGQEPAPDGTRIAVVRSALLADNVWLVAPDGSNPVQVTHFSEGRVFDVTWTRDSRRLIIMQGDRRREVVFLEEADSP